MVDKKDITGFILAGGKSSRMGKDKGLLTFKNMQMIEYAIEALQPICKSIIILSNNSEYEKFGYKVYPDVVKNSGPLAGICTGLSESKTKLNIFLSCDSPFVTTDFLEHLVQYASDFDAVAPFYKGKTYPLTAMYKTSCSPVFNKMLKNRNLRVREVLDLLNSKIIDFSSNLSFFDDKILTNINTPKELENCLKEFDKTFPKV